MFSFKDFLHYLLACLRHLLLQHIQNNVQKPIHFIQSFILCIQMMIRRLKMPRPVCCFRWPFLYTLHTPHLVSPFRVMLIQFRCNQVRALERGLCHPARRMRVVPLSFAALCIQMCIQKCTIFLCGWVDTCHILSQTRRTEWLHISTVCFDMQHLNSKTRLTADCAASKFQLVMVASHLWVATHLLTCGRVMAI